jgi:hypothetical protein
VSHPDSDDGQGRPGVIVGQKKGGNIEADVPYRGNRFVVVGSCIAVILGVCCGTKLMNNAFCGSVPYTLSVNMVFPLKKEKSRF